MLEPPCARARTHAYTHAHAHTHTHTHPHTHAHTLFSLFCFYHTLSFLYCFPLLAAKGNEVAARQTCPNRGPGFMVAHIFRCIWALLDPSQAHTAAELPHGRRLTASVDTAVRPPGLANNVTQKRRESGWPFGCTTQNLHAANNATECAYIYIRDRPS